ncbi:MAG: hypothetical protein AB7T63_15265 [Planctomycetota bacterium]
MLDPRETNMEQQRPPEEKGGIPLALLGWLIGVPGLIVLLLLIF